MSHFKGPHRPDSLRNRDAPLTPDEETRARDRRDRMWWRTANVWTNRPQPERKRLLAETDEVEVVYDGAGFDSARAPEGGFRARARVTARDARTIEATLTEPLRVMESRGLTLYAANEVLRFTTGGKHKDEPRTTIILVPAGWREAPYPGDAPDASTA